MFYANVILDGFSLVSDKYSQFMSIVAHDWLMQNSNLKMDSFDPSWLAFMLPVLDIYH